MRIGLNLLYLLPGEVGGTQTYAEGLITHLAGAFPEHEFVLYLNEESVDWFTEETATMERIICPVRASSRRNRYTYEQLRLPARLREDNIEVLHSLGYVGPLRTHCPHVVTIHDINYRGQREYLSVQKQLGLRVSVETTARRADRIIAVSQFSKDEIVNATAATDDKVTVIHHGAPEIPFQERQRHDSDADELRRLGIIGPYIVALSSLSPAKNLSPLIEAYSQIPERKAYRLVLIGHAPDGSYLSNAIEKSGMGHRIHHTGYVEQQLLWKLMRNASLFAFPSLYEGFGLPLLDAQLLRVPIIASQTCSVPEVAGDGAYYFNPTSILEMQTAISTVLNSPGKQAKLVTAGFENLKRFDWRDTAQRTVDVYEEIAKRN